MVRIVNNSRCLINCAFISILLKSIVQLIGLVCFRRDISRKVCFSDSGKSKKSISRGYDIRRNSHQPSVACRSMPRAGMILAVAMLVLILFAGAASAAVNTYYWEPSNGVNVAGYTTDWGGCDARPAPGAITTLRTGGYGLCSSDRIEATSNNQDQFLAISKTQYATETQITGQGNALFVFRESGTYRLDLGYATGGTFTSFGYVTKSFDSNNGLQYSIDLSSITGTAPADSYLALKVSLVSGVSQYNNPRMYVGSSAINGDASGQFSVDEVAGSSSPTYDVTVTPSPTSAGVNAGSNFIYTITVNNNGNTAGNYNLGVIDSNSADFQASVLGSTTLSINKGSSAQTTLTVTANTGVSGGQSDITTVTATSVEDPTNYSSSAQVTTTVGAPQGPSKVIVKTNRNVILDDPNRDIGGGSKDNWGSDHWNGETTMIRAYALVLDGKGNAIANQAITFSISEITGSQSSTNTNSDGIASFSYQLNDAGKTGSKTPGSYTLIADTGSVSDSTTFTYSYFGCSRCHGDKGILNNINPKSPYITTYNTFHTSTSSHEGGEGSSEINANKCNFCHTSYGTEDGNTVNPKTFGVHSTSQNCVDCHGMKLVDAPADIKDCDSCHPRTTGNDKVKNFASASFWSNGMIQFSSLPMVAHQGTPAIPCVICHGPMHNTTTPDGINSLNTYTEESECLTCHTTKGKHSSSNPIVCTACHSQDAHAIGVLNKATGNSFVKVGSTNAMTSNTADCKECHSDNTEDAYFGGLTGMSGYGYTDNYDPFGKYDTIHPTGNCANSCHDLTDFHSIGEGGGGADCLSCHNSTGSTLHRVDGNAISIGIHADLNAISPVDPNSKCWACHQTDGTAPQNSMGDIYNAPYKCIECHTSLGQKPGAYGAFIVDEHYPSGDDIKVLTGDNLAACVTCHNKSEMKVAYTSPDGIFTNYSLISHYGKKRTDMQIGSDTDCFYCHNGSSAFDAQFQNPANIQITHNNGQACTDCHNSAGATSGRIHDASLIGGGGPDCVSCHDGSGRGKVDVNSINNSGYIHYNLNNNSNTGTLDTANRMCWACHTNNSLSSDNVVNESEMPKGHPDGYNAPKICTDCHDSTVKFGADLISEHIPTGTGIQTTYSCVQCHNNSIRPFIDTQTNLTSNTNMTDPDFNMGRVSHYADTSELQSSGIDSIYCLNCHNDPVEGLKYGLAYQNDRHGILECRECHRSETDPTPIANLHAANLKNEPAFYNDELNNSCVGCHPSSSWFVGSHGDNAAEVNCLNCHVNKTTSIIYKKTIAPGIRNTNTVFHTNGSKSTTYPKALVPGNISLDRGTLEYTRSQCTICHDGAVDHNPTGECAACHASNNERSTWHSTNIAGGGGPDCISCHDIGGGAVHKVDASVIASGIHGLLNNKTSNPNEVCWGCHQTGGTEPTGMGDRYDTPYICTDCHLESSLDVGLYNAPIVAEHFKSGLDILAVTGAVNNVSSCLGCHQDVSEMILPNNDAENGTFDTDGNGIYGGSTNPYHYGKIRTDMVVGIETNCSYCHQSTSEFNGVFQDISNIDITHNGGKSCFICHREEASVDGRIHDSSLIGGGGGACIECHSVSGSATVINEGDLGGHMNINTTIGGNNNLTSEDCMACHFDNPHSGPDATNTYYCADCHTSTGTSPIKSTIEFTDKLHGENTCIDCHVADGTYHQNDPRGSVANLTYIARYGPGNTTITDCADCHYASNLDDAPFNAPAGGSHIPGNGGACAGSCHTSGIRTMIQTVHDVGVGPGWGNTKPSITVPVLNTASVSQGNDVTVTATVAAAGQFHYVDGAQYRLMNGITEVLPWTPMTAVDGDFEGASENVTTTLNTSSLSLGTYTVEVRGMAGGPVQDPSARYYPMNGDLSLIKSATLTVQQPPGYINGTVKSGGSNLSGVLVSTTGATDTTGPDGTYSLIVSAGTYTVTASKQPEYYDNTTLSEVVVVFAGEITLDFNLMIKPTGSISGNVKGGTT